MNITLSLSEINNDNIFICKQEQNKSNKNNLYYKLNYILTDYTLYGIYIIIDKNINTTKIRNIESYILSKISKTPKFNIYNNLYQNRISHQGKVLRIIGIWENDYHCGLNYKII